MGQIFGVTFSCRNRGPDEKGTETLGTDPYRYAKLLVCRNRGPDEKGTETCTLDS